MMFMSRTLVLMVWIWPYAVRARPPRSMRASGHSREAAPPFETRSRSLKRSQAAPQDEAGRGSVAHKSVAVRQSNRKHALYALPVEGRLHAAAVELERALRPHRIGPLEDPILPRGEAGEDLGLHGLRAGEAQVRLHAGEGVGREARALLQHDAHFVVPVIGLHDAGDEAECVSLLGFERRADLRPQLVHMRGVADEARRKAGEPVGHGIEAEIRLPERDRRGR